MAGWQAYLQDIYYKCSIYAFVSNLKSPTFSKVMGRNLLGGLMNWATVKVGDNAERLRKGQKCGDIK